MAGAVLAARVPNLAKAMNGVILGKSIRPIVPGAGAPAGGIAIMTDPP
jgi:hypothetical protein